MTGQLYDLAIVGYGPTGMLLAALAGKQGWRVAVLERYAGLYNLPRAACFDDEIMRIFQKLGLVEEVLPGVVAQPDYEWVNADGETLLHLHYDDPAPGGWAALYMMYQPHLETVLDRRCKSLENIDVMQGVTVYRLLEREDRVIVSGERTDGGAIEIAARFAIGADGGSSFVRRAIGAQQADYGFEENWLVCDFHMPYRPASVPTFRQVCDPAQPTSIVRIGPEHHRFSFMLAADDRAAHATDHRRVWERVAPYVTQADAELVRVANYVFRSRITERWRDGRVLLAGDAAHEMPPFLAQGMCSGMRDGHNLAWKLDLVLAGHAGPELLDTYQPEREGHVRFITEKAIDLGRVQTLRDPVRARERDERLIAQYRAGTEPQKLRYPNLRGGLFAAGHAGRHAGEFFTQARVRSVAGEQRFDDAVGVGACILVRTPALAETLTAPQISHWRALGGHVALLADITGERDERPVIHLADPDCSYGDWFASHQCDAVIVRPDWYVYGTASDAGELAAIVNGLLSRLTVNVTELVA